MTGSLFGVGAVIVMSSVMVCVPILSSAAMTMVQSVSDRVVGAVIVRVLPDMETTGFEAVQVDVVVSCLKVKVSPSGSVKYGFSGMV